MATKKDPFTISFTIKGKAFTVKGRLNAKTALKLIAAITAAVKVYQYIP